ncbi:hypothetical protein I4U23_024775 [Adineta vaga]|nr:hypothetical protein I4U23_024775 [Adineta vaga]
MSNAIDSSITTGCDKDKKKTVCGGCGDELEPDHPGIQCIQSHHYCVECSTRIVNLFFSEPQNYTPLRCLQCHVDLNPAVFERQLTPEQLDFYLQHMLVLVWAKAFLKKDERLDNCPFCAYAVIRKINDPKFLYCTHSECGIMSCLVCLKACPTFSSAYATDEQFDEMSKHFTCSLLDGDKQEFDQYLEAGQKVPCPNCGLAGMKDDACTHMTCPTCSQLWCYFCGGKVEDCDKSIGGTNGIFDHNHHWESNVKRCPMYFTQICDADDRWAPDEQQCLALFHRIRSLRLLREVYNKLGKERIDELENHFRILSTCGFTLDEILNENLTLIRNRNNTPRLCLLRDDDDDER